MNVNGGCTRWETFMREKKIVGVGVSVLDYQNFTVAIEMKRNLWKRGMIMS